MPPCISPTSEVSVDDVVHIRNLIRASLGIHCHDWFFVPDSLTHFTASPPPVSMKAVRSLPKFQFGTPASSPCTGFWANGGRIFKYNIQTGKEKASQVRKGKNDISNYQALCWQCNANKGNRSSTDFRNIDAFYENRKKDCLFCDVQVTDRPRIVEENELAYATRDGYPVSQGHTLFIPKRHAMDYSELVQAEINAINALMLSQKAVLQSEDPTIEGFNIGMNCGEIAGQSVFHRHVHLIPRRKGDVEKPRGGVRNLMPGKGAY